MKPLNGLTVLDVSWHGPGVITAWLLAGMGARVIKIEPPDGTDFVRSFGPKVGKYTLGQLAFDRGKESLAIDIRHNDGAESLRKVAEHADVVIEGFRPGVAERLGIGYKQLSARHPGLVYCAVSGFPRSSNMANVAAHDLNYMAESGVLSLVHARSSAAIPSVQVADYIGATMAAYAIVSGCLQVARTGVGIECEASLFDAARFAGVLSTVHARSGAADHDLIGMQLGGALACYGLYECRDGGHIAVAALETKFWKRLCELTELSRFVECQMDMQRQEEMRGALSTKFAERTQDQWMTVFAGEDVCVGAVKTMTQVESARLETDVQRLHPDYPIHVAGVDTNLETPPEIGQHSRSILIEAGISEAEVDDLLGKKVIRTHEV